MTVNSTECAPETVTAPDGAQLVACAHGGHVLGWTPAGGVPRLWLSPTAQCGPGKAIRGGIPVIFPQFSDRGSLPKHGFARDRAWSGSSFSDGSAVTWQATLGDSAETRALWPHRFELQVTARAAGDQLDVTLTVVNHGGAPMAFSAALHTYLAIGGSGATIDGLDGLVAEDNASPGSSVSLTGSLDALEERDVAVLSVPGPVVLSDPELGTVTVTADGFPDRVVWNPGPRHSLGDVPKGDERHFVCIEPALLESFVVNSTDTWNGRLTLVARSPETSE